MLGSRRYDIRLLIRKVPPSIRLMAAVMFFFELGFGFIDPWWAIYISGITSNYFITGVIISLFSLTGLIMALPLGQAIDHFNHRQIIRVALMMYLLVAGFYFVAGYLSSIWFLVLAVLVNGISSIIIYQTSQAYVDRNYLGDKSFNYSLVVSLDALGYLVGILLVLTVIASWPLYYGYLAVAACILATLLVAKRLPTSSPKVSNFGKVFGEIFSGRTLVAAIKSLPRYSGFFYIQILGIFTILFINFGFQIFLPLFGIEEHLSLIEVGLVAVLFQLPFFLSVYYATLVERLAKSKIVFSFFVGMALLLFIFYFWHSAVAFYLVSFLLSSAIAILNLTIRPVLFSLSPPHLEGEAAAITKFAEKLATILSPIVVGILAVTAGLNWSYILFAGLALVVGLVAGHFYRQAKVLPVAVESLTKPTHRSGN